MVVDDDSAIIEILQEILMELGFHVVSASDGREGLELLDTVSVDGVFLDLDMTTMDGQTMLDEIRWRGHHMPVLVTTGSYDQPFLDNLVNEGAQGISSNPLKANDQTTMPTPIWEIFTFTRLQFPRMCWHFFKSPMSKRGVLE